VFCGEIDGFTTQYHYSLDYQTIASILSCIAGITGSLFFGKFLDKYRCYKKMQIFIALLISALILSTFLGLKYHA
jgi:predicted MFS family arabinose efflux permease